jgi:diguanylate cyclase (GGDEF)-like protein
VALVLIIGITLVLHRNVLIRQLREKARTDPKTGLLNAAGWSTAVDAELARAARANLPCGLLVIDLDHFKAFNDAYGHLAGDDILRAVANTISAEVRAYDIVGRFGGEEFVVLLPATTDTETVHVAERIRARIAALPLPSPDDQLTVSIGVSVFPQHCENLDGLLHTADMAMYAAKAAGRDRVHLSGTAPATVDAVDTVDTVESRAPRNGTSQPVPLAQPIPNGTHPAVEPNAV